MDYRARRAAEEAASRRARVVAGLVFAVVVIVLALLFSWMRTTGGGQGGAGIDEPTSSVAAHVGETKALVDTAGREVRVPAEPRSIAVMDSFSGELAVMIGAGPRLCGVPGGVRSDKILQMVYPQLTTDPTATSGSAVNIEELLSRNCDLVIVRSSMESAELGKLDRAGIPYVVVGYDDMASQIAAIRVVGQACGNDAAAKAEQLAQLYEQTIALVEERAAAIPEDGRVRVFHSINDALLTDAADSLGADWVTRVGCVDVSAETPANSKDDFSATIEEVYRWDPDAVICNVAATADEVRADVKWSSVAAVRAGQVFNIPIGATRWGQRGSVETYFAMLWLGCTVYPDAYADVDLRQMVTDNYRDVLGVEVTDGLWDAIVSGEGIRSYGNGGGNA